MSYVDAPSTKLLATHCVICCRPLREAKSVEWGMGPKCREGLEPESDISEAVRVEANRIIASAAQLVMAKQPGLAPMISRLKELGLPKVAERIAETHLRIQVKEVDGKLLVKVPFKEGFSQVLRQTGVLARWDRDVRMYDMPSDKSTKEKLWTVMKKFFLGEEGYSRLGVFSVA